MKSKITSFLLFFTIFTSCTTMSDKKIVEECKDDEELLAALGSKDYKFHHSGESNFGSMGFYINYINNNKTTLISYLYHPPISKSLSDFYVGESSKYWDKYKFIEECSINGLKANLYKAIIMSPEK